MDNIGDRVVPRFPPPAPRLRPGIARAMLRAAVGALERHRLRGHLNWSHALDDVRRDLDAALAELEP